MKSKYTTRKTTNSGGKQITRYSSGKVKGSGKPGARKKVKTATYTLTTDHKNQKTYGSGTKTKRVYKNGKLIKKRTKNLSMRQILNRP